MKIPLKNRSGEQIKEISVSDALFGLPITSSLRGVMHQAVVRQSSNTRRGTSDTKTRGQVVGSTRKILPQKGTGRARQGSNRSPLRRGGGVIFGPHPRSYRQRMPKKMRLLAIRGALSSKAAEGHLAVVDDLGIQEPKSKDMIDILAALGATSSALVVTSESQQSVIKSAQNLQGVKTLPAPYLNVLDLLSCDLLVMELGAVRRAEELWAPGGSPPDEPEEEKPGTPAKEKKPPTRRKRVARKPKAKADV